MKADAVLSKDIFKDRNVIDNMPKILALGGFKIVVMYYAAAKHMAEIGIAVKLITVGPLHVFRQPVPRGHSIGLLLFKFAIIRIAGTTFTRQHLRIFFIMSMAIFIRA